MAFPNIVTDPTSVDPTSVEGSTIHIASPPFDDPQADVIIRTSDHVEFRIFRLILKMASTVFADILALPVAPDADPNAIDVTEDSVVWDHILRICHPGIAPPAMIAADQLWPLLEAAKKYDMKAVRETAVREMSTPRMLEQETLRVYALACGYGVEDVAVAAARASLTQSYEEGPYVPELRCATSAAYFRLVQYRRECVKAAVSFAEDPHLFLQDGWKDYVKYWILRREHVSEQHDDGCSSGGNFALDSWEWGNGLLRDVLVEYMARSTEALKVLPHGSTVLNPIFIATTVHAASKCTACRSRTQPSDVLAFLKFHASQIDAATAKVKLVVAS
ncbi:uncharacterized protein B0H18DRAFT_1032691 [Fomitopsis serialis]|uniref:uncharacterized protein n=1 Tax=Fomitopsis serialis TaxID=139415 RepID=UPI002008DA41|nr:uncharacterized protein B0H18DRAFT_1032691 [Neoantrodia serialis]KAH9917997.1 hypothetical protein B0H18DRAFT_1032691 [Neoantrodia serialis]